MSGKFFKYFPNVWLAQTTQECKKGDIVSLETKYGKEVQVKIFNLIGKRKNGEKFYSFVRLDDESYAERKARKYRESEALHKNKSNELCEKAYEGYEFLRLGEPIKIGHHSEKRHRALLECNDRRMANSIKEEKIAQEKADKAEYWEEKAQKINLSMPESLEFFQDELEKAIQKHQGLKNGTIPRAFGFETEYARNAVKELTKKVEIAKKLWA